MSRVVALFSRELRSQVYSPIAWVVWTLFLFLAGWFFFSLVYQFAVIVENTNAYAAMMQAGELSERLNLNELVIAGLFGNLLILLVFLIPVLTMRSFAEERKQGTDELLLTAPVTPGQLVAGKYLGQLAIGFMLVVASAFYIAVLLHYGDPERGPILTGLLGLMLVIAALTAIGFAVFDGDEEPGRRGGRFVRLVSLALRRRLAVGIDRRALAGGAQGALAPGAFRRLCQRQRRLDRRCLLRLAHGARALRRAGVHRLATLEIIVKDALRIVGYAGTVLLVFGLLSFAFSGIFDAWTAVHIVCGGVCILVSLAANLSGVVRAIASRGTRQRAQAATGTLVFTAILVALNILAARFPRTWDATEAKVFTLSDKTLAVLKHLDKPVELAAFLPSGDRSKAALETLLGRYTAENHAVTFRIVDPEKDPQEADRFEVRSEGVLAARSGNEKAQASASRTGELGEGDVTGLILKVTRPGGKRLYALTGHGEPELDDVESAAGLGGVAAVLKEDNVEIHPLFLATTEAVPEDAAGILVVGPMKSLIPHEIDALKAYLAEGGRLFAMINPGADAALGPCSPSTASR
jgi:hypothetical protein